MTNPAALVQQHATAIINALVQTLDSPDGRARLKAAKLLLLWGSGPAGGKLPGSERDSAGPAGGLSPAEQRCAIDLLLPHIRSEPKAPNPSTTSCPARQRPARPQRLRTPPRANPATNPMSLERAAPPENTPLAEPALTPCPAAVPAAAAPEPAPNPGTNPMSREPCPSPLAAPPGTDPPRRDADPISRALLPVGHGEAAFRRRLPLAAPVEPAWLHGRHAWPAHRRKRWT